VEELVLQVLKVLKDQEEMEEPQDLMAVTVLLDKPDLKV